MKTLKSSKSTLWIYLLMEIKVKKHKASKIKSIPQSRATKLNVWKKSKVLKKE